MNKPFLLGSYYEEERLETENKSFHLYFESLSGMTEDDIFDMMRTGRWIPDFNKIVESNLLEFIYNILPKYVACFGNAQLDGCLNIGVDDNSELTGIPYLGEISLDSVYETVHQTLRENLDVGENLEGLINSIRVECIELEIDVNVLQDEAEVHFENYSRDIIKYNNAMEVYLTQHALFLIQHRKYSQKLESMLNITQYRKELSTYIQQKAPRQHQHLIDELEGERFIKLRQDNFLVPQERENRDRIFYWIAKFRDGKTHENSVQKPTKPLHTSIYHPQQILSNLPVMRAKFIRSNPDLRYFMLRILCPTSRLGGVVKFWDRFNHKWLYRKRVNMSWKRDGPSCVC